MSKEQTPITYVIDLVNPNDITHRKNCIIRKGRNWNESEKEIIEKALNGDLITKEEAQAKVLEALEREFKEHLPKFKELVIENNQNEVDFHHGDLSVLTYLARNRSKEIEEYYETEVKPKYKI